MPREIGERALWVRLSENGLRGFSNVRLPSPRIHGWMGVPCNGNQLRTDMFSAAADVGYVTCPWDLSGEGDFLSPFPYSKVLATFSLSTQVNPRVRSGRGWVRCDRVVKRGLLSPSQTAERFDARRGRMGCSQWASSRTGSATSSGKPSYVVMMVNMFPRFKCL